MNYWNQPLSVGYVTPTDQDVLPSTGPHLDVRVSKEGKYIDPSTIRSLLTKLKVGKEKKPLWEQKQDGTWQPNFPITSGYGPRKAPPGGSRFHPAHDYGIAANTPLFFEGPGTFTPGQGFGTITTADASGNPYQIKLLHTKGGRTVQADQLQKYWQGRIRLLPWIEGEQGTKEPDNSAPTRNIYNIYISRKRGEDSKDLDLFGNPLNFLSSFINTRQNDSGQTEKLLAQAFGMNNTYNAPFTPYGEYG